MELYSMFKSHPRVTAEPRGTSRTKQSFAEESEINRIVARYQKTGIVDHVAKYGGMYGDMPDQDDFHEAMNLVTEAQTMFNDLPSNVRSRFTNDPAEFLEFVSDPENRDEMIKMGLITSGTASEADEDPPAADPPAKPPAIEPDPPAPEGAT